VSSDDLVQGVEYLIEFPNLQLVGAAIIQEDQQVNICSHAALEQQTLDTRIGKKLSDTLRVPQIIIKTVRPNRS
jgi:hypothetical protein